MSISSVKRVAVASVVVAAAVTAARGAAAPPLPTLTWQTVVNNTVQMPGSDRTFNSYNQPSVNEDGLVVIRARSRGGEGGEGGGCGGGGGGGGCGESGAPAIGATADVPASTTDATATTTAPATTTESAASTADTTSTDAAVDTDDTTHSTTSATTTTEATTTTADTTSTDSAITTDETTDSAATTDDTTDSASGTDDTTDSAADTDDTTATTAPTTTTEAAASTAADDTADATTTTTAPTTTTETAASTADTTSTDATADIDDTTATPTVATADAPETHGPTHGIYTRDMGTGGTVEKVVDRTSPIPAPNNLGSTFIETPAFPRIDASSALFAFRGNSQPVWRYGEGQEETAGTTGVYGSVGGTLVTGASKLGGVPGFGFYAVPGLGTSFEVFPGAPSPTGSTIVFKGNYTEGGAARTGVFYRDLTAEDSGGSASVQSIATSSSTPIPGTSTVFGSLSPPSAAAGKAAFAGYDDEANPTLGGIYVAPVASGPTLTLVTGIGSPVPDWNGKATAGSFNRLGEAVSFDGRFVAFWGAWGTDTREVTVVCPTEGNVARQELCRSQNGGDPEYRFQVPVHQGIFVHDIRTGGTRLVAQTGSTFRDFVYWAFTGKVAGSIEGDDGEPATWRSSAYVAVAGGGGANFRIAFKATTSDGVTGVYLAAGPGRSLESFVTAVDTTTSGTELDPAAPQGSVVTEIGLERDGFRGEWLVVTAKMGSEENGMAGVYAARVRWP